MTQTSKVTVQPKKIIVKDIEWSTEEIQNLKNLFDGKLAVNLEKREIRNSDLLQKAMQSDVVQNLNVQEGDRAQLFLSQVGLDLMEML